LRNARNARAFEAPVEFASIPEEDKPLAAEALRSQQLLFDSRRSSNSTERSVLEQRIRQHAEQIAGIESQKFSNEMQKDLPGEELEGLRKLVPSGYVALNRVRAMERSVADLDGKEGTLRSDSARLTEAIGEARLEVLGIDRRDGRSRRPSFATSRFGFDGLAICRNWFATRQQIAVRWLRATASGSGCGSRVFTEGGVVSAGDDVDGKSCRTTATLGAIPGQGGRRPTRTTCMFRHGHSDPLPGAAGTRTSCDHRRQDA